ncbi:protein phosphatase [Aliiroseovarius halocynthiae]|uniref:Serine/threonine-protein phosphatase n=1 Tax=Aliiroseovarius halocynthiae TaxID=985055 RepID=A0A545SPG7_9RHOB|nr:protein phosphatase 2C domain-containing protein [Aliiroseovarius halocynthiae]TQV66837.1 serine/threonine-protein phosphatase [Aliiroseovarius halocynthiae]SMR82326.1 protein phosphatase [Aliiroseovarius halocynthiae]
MLANPAYDIALVADQGKRDTQEDAIAARFFDDLDAGYVVVADGMGGHDAGDVASALVKTTWQSELDGILEGGDCKDGHVVEQLNQVVLRANDAVANYLDENGSELRMGSTLLGVLLRGKRLNWVSVGDSPLYLCRNGFMMRINEDHSMAPMIDAQISDGTLSEEEARTHPDRNQLTSVIMGAPVPKLDCPETAVELAKGDVLLAASDGLQYLEDDQIQSLAISYRDQPARDLAVALVQALRAKAHPDQDNTTIAVIKPLNI